MRKTILGAVAAVAVVALAACQMPPPTTIDIHNENTNTNNNGGTGGPSPSPSPGSQTIARVGIGAFGETCRAGVTPAGGERDNTVRVGCKAAITCSPIDPQGNEIHDDTVHGKAPDFFGAVVASAAIAVAQWSSQAFNVDAEALAAGTVTLTCTVKGITSAPYTLTAVP